MSVPPEYFARVVGSVNFPLLQGKRVAVIGVGQVGSLIAKELANCGVGYLLLIDHDRLETPNLFRHVLPEDYLGWNKAEALAVYLERQVENLSTQALPRRVDDAVSDSLLDQWLSGVDLIVAATDDPDAQKRIGLRALVLGMSSIFPALYADGGGEVIVQLDRDYPCFNCWSAFRDGAEHLRGVTAVGFNAYPVMFTALVLALAILDPRSEASELMTNGPGQAPTQVFLLDRFGSLDRQPFVRLRGCPSCGTVPDPSPPPAYVGRRIHKQHRIEQRRARHSQMEPVSDKRTTDQVPQRVAESSHPAAHRSSNADPAELIGSGFCVVLWWFVFTEGFNGFQAWWNPIAWAAVIWWFFHAFNS